MRKDFAIIIVMMLAVMSSCCQKCKNARGAEETKVYCYKDSCKHLQFSISLEVPVGTVNASTLIRASLVADFMLNCRQLGYFQDEFCIDAYTGDLSDVQAVVDYFGKAGYDFILKDAISDYEDRITYVEESTTYSAEEKEELKKEMPKWIFELSTYQSADTLGFVLYQSEGYTYMGGAHGGVIGSGSLTFDKKTGKKIDRFVKADATEALQPMIRQGLVEYYRGDGDDFDDSDLDGRLLIDDKTIPQPVAIPCPDLTGDSLVFTYQQYEITCYADGMPTFAVAVKDLMPYLTDEGKALLEQCKKK